MSAWRPHLAAAAGLFRRDLTVYLSYRWRLGPSTSAAFSLAVFYYISRLVRVEAFTLPEAYSPTRRWG